MIIYGMMFPSILKPTNGTMLLPTLKDSSTSQPEPSPLMLFGIHSTEQFLESTSRVNFQMLAVLET